MSRTKTYSVEVKEARKIGYRLAKKNGSVSIDQVRKNFEKKFGYWGNFAGAVFRDDRFIALGERASTAPVSHGRPVTVWALTTTPAKPETMNLY